MSFKATSLVFMLAAFAVLAPVRSAPTFQARHEGHDDTMSTSSSAATPAATSAPADAPNFVKQNGLDAQKLNAQFAAAKVGDSCQAGQMACVTSQFAQCVDGKWALTPCPADLKCFALPLVNKAGTSIVCDTQDDALARFAATGVSGGTTGTDTTSTPSGSASAPSPTPTGDDDCDDDTDNGPSGTDDDCDDDDDSTSNVPEGTPISVKSATPTVLAPSTTLGYGSDDATPTTITLIAAPEKSTGTTPISLTTITLARRQILTLNTPSSSATPTASSTSVETLATVPVTSSSSASIPVITPATTSSSSDSVATPTVVIGTDGFVTVTLVSTVTVSATGCSAPTVPTTVPTLAPVPVTSATPSSSTDTASSSSASASSSSAIGASPSSFTFSFPSATASPAAPAAGPTGSTVDSSGY